MKHSIFKWVLLGVAVALVMSVVSCSPKNPQAPTEPLKQLRLGWQPPWANQGQIVEVFKHSEVLARHDVQLEYKPFTYGGPMTEAALAGEVDVLFVGDQPAITLISRDPKWRIIARMVNYRSAFLVPPNSSVRDLKDLKGKTVATAFGSTTHRDAVRILEENGLQVGKDLRLINIDQAEHAALIARGGSQSWGDIAAIATYDPTIAVGVQGNRARVLKEWTSSAVVVTSADLIEQRPADLLRFLQAYIESFSVYARDPNHYDALYSADSRLPLPSEVYRSMAAYEPNLNASDPVSVEILLDAPKLAILQQAAEAAIKVGIIKRSLDMREYVDQHLAEEATRLIRSAVRPR